MTSGQPPVGLESLWTPASPDRGMSGVFSTLEAGRVSPRRTGDHAKVMVFVDGQNLCTSCAERFGRPHCHPLLLPRHLAGNRRLVGVRCYSGLHDPRGNPPLNARVQRRHHLIRRTGVTVVERQVRHRWERGSMQSDLPDPRGREGTTETVQLAPHRRAREKGVDVALALDVIDLAQNGHVDVESEPSSTPRTWRAPSVRAAVAPTAPAAPADRRGAVSGRRVPAAPRRSAPR